MKIILINNLYSPWTRGGAEKIVEKTAEGLEQKGHEVFVIATAPTGSHTDRVFYLPSIFYNLEKYSLLERFFWHLWDIFNFSHAAKIKKILVEKKPELVITHNLQGVGYLLPRLLRKMKIRHFHTLHDVQLLHPSGLIIFGRERITESLPAKIYQMIMRALIGSPELVISPSQWLMDEHLKRGFFKNSRKIILPNFFSEKKSVQNIKHRISDTKYQFLYVGQVEAHKGVKLIIEAFSDFLEKNKGVKAELAIAGGGSGLEEAKKLSGGKPEIKIIGRKNQGEVEELMLAADCLIVPSLCYENSPTVIYEAIGAGLPVIASAIGGIPELIAAAGGIVFSPGNRRELVEKIVEAVFSPKKLEEIRYKESVYHPADYLSELALLAADNNRE